MGLTLEPNQVVNVSPFKTPERKLTHYLWRQLIRHHLTSRDKHSGYAFSQLHQLFEVVLCSSANSTPVERVFSQSGLFMRPHRAKCQMNCWKRLSFWNATHRPIVDFPMKLAVVAADWDDYNCVYLTWFYVVVFKYTTLILSLKCEALALDTVGLVNITDFFGINIKALLLNVTR